MAERTENSVLVSLRELRGIEEDRLKREQEDARARAEAEKAAREAAERRALQEAEDRKRAEEDRLRRLEEDKLAKVREEQLRIEEADRRARMEGELKLQEQKMRLELQSRAQHRSPTSGWKAIVGVAAVVIAIAGVVVYRIQAANQAATAERERAVQEERERHRASQAELERKLAAISRDMEAKLKLANGEAEQAKIRAAAEKAKREALTEEHVAAKTPRRGKPGSADATAGKPAGGRMPGKIEIKDDDILKGL